MRTLGRDDILGADDLERRTIEVPEWGGSVIAQEMTALIREEFEAAVVSMHGTDPVANRENVRAQLVVFTLIDDDGSRLFSAGDVEALGGKSGKALVRICEVVQEMNGLGAEEVEELAEDFGGDPSDDSTTG